MYVYPDFYPDFQCIASFCRHSCCRGWEIDIDPESMAEYKKVDGELGQKLKSCIAVQPTPHFVLTDEEACPFLRSDGLCRLIIDLGENSLCDICAEHPRFYNEYPSRVEVGLGVCCEEAARLLLDGRNPLAFIVESDGDTSAELIPQLKMRERIFKALGVQDTGLTERMKKAVALIGGAPMLFNVTETADFFKTLESMDSEWSALLDELSRLKNPLNLESAINSIRYERVAEYFVYRYFALGKTVSDCVAWLQFAFLSTYLICSLELIGAADALRIYSAEIEYSDENVGLVLEFIKQTAG